MLSSFKLVSNLKSINCLQVFETYGEMYQPYLPPVMEALKDSEDLQITLMSYTKSSKVDWVAPSYRKRQLKVQLYKLKHPIDLNYLGVFSLQKKIDILHFQHSYMFEKAKSILNLPKNKRPKIVITLRGGDTYVKPWFSEKWKNFYVGFGNQIDAFVVMSKHQKKYLHERWNIDLDRIFIIPISFGFPFEANTKSPNKNVIKIVSAYRMCWEKNIEGNLRVIKNLKNKDIPVRYDVFGDGSDIGQLYYLIDKYNLQDCVLVHGRVSNNKLKDALLKSDFFLQLSHSESLGMSVIEAQTLGLPAIVSNSDGLPEVVIDEKTGYCVCPSDTEQAALKLETLWKDKELYKKFSKDAISFSQQQFSITREVEKLTLLYKTLKES